MAHFSTRVPAGRSLFFGFYATGHSHFGQPSPSYVAALMQMAEHLPRVDGILVYTTKATPEHNRECANLPPPLFGGEMGCIVRDAFRRLRGDFLYGASCTAQGGCGPVAI